MVSALSLCATVGLLALVFTRRRVWLLVSFYGVYGFLKVLALDNSEIFNDLVVFRALYALMFLSFLVRLFQDDYFSLNISRWPLLGYGGVLACFIGSAAYSPSSHVYLTGDPANGLATIAIVLLFWLAASQIQRDIDFRLFATATIVVSLLLSFWVIGVGALAGFAVMRGGVDINQNFLSVFILTGAVPLAERMFTASKIWRRILAAALLLITIFASLLLASRGMMMAFLAALVVMSFQWFRRLGSKKALAFGAVLLLIFTVATFLPGGHELVTRFHDSDVSTLNGRSLVWSYALGYFNESGIVRMTFGNGLTSSLSILPPVMTSDLWSYHNEYLTWLMDQGIIGLIVFLGFGTAIVTRVLRSKHPSRNVMIGWLGFLAVAGLSGTMSAGHSMWILLGVITGASALAAPNDAQDSNMTHSKQHERV